MAFKTDGNEVEGVTRFHYTILSCMIRVVYAFGPGLGMKMLLAFCTRPELPGPG
jgi:hypothetical protein